MDNILDKLNRNILDMEVVCEKFSADVEDYANVENHDEILEQVFDDSYIKAQKSPFQIYPDDRRKDLPENIIPDFKRVVQEYRSGVIDIRMMNILEIIINHRYITTRQIWQLYLLLFKKYIKYQHLNKLLKRMSEQGLIAIYETESAIGNAKYHFYCVDYNGARLYSSQHKQSSWQKTDVILPIEIMKKSLAKNQFLIACLKHYDFQYELQPRLKWCENNQAKTVVPTIQMTFNKENKDGNIVLMVEVLRNSQRWKEEYQEKLVRYGQYLKSKEDTQELNRYYLIVCAESNEQILSAINVRYDLENKLLDSYTCKINIFYTHDLKLLDHHIEKSIFNDLKGFKYSYENNAWMQTEFPEIFQEHDWHDILFTMEKIPTTEKNTEQIEEKPHNKKWEYALKIYQLVKEQGMQFPVEAVKLAPLLKTNNLNYMEFGYKNLKETFTDLSEFYKISYPTPTEMLIDCIQKPAETINKEADFEYNAIIDYFTFGFVDRKKWTTEFENNIFWYNKRDITATFLNKMTKNYDLSIQGWLDIIAFSYYRAKSQNRIWKSTSTDISRICFDTHLLTFEGEKIFLLAKKNYRANPEWVLEGLSTVHSKSLGQILKTEFNELENE